MPEDAPSDAAPLLQQRPRTTAKGSGICANGKILTLALVVSVGGLLFGFDTGVISGALPYLRDDLLAGYASQPGRLAFLQEAIVSSAIVAAGGGSALGGFIADAFGRRTALLAADVLFTAGALCMAAAQGVPALIAGRVGVGLAVGLASVTVPVYIAECAPAEVRATLVTLNVLMITSGQFLAYLSNYCFSFLPGNWRWMLGVAALPSALQLLALLLLPESPAWLAGQGRAVAAHKAATRLHLNPQDADQQQQVELEGGSAAQHGRRRTPLRLLGARGVRQALHVGVGLQVLQQVAGINTAMYFAPTIIQLAGVHDNRTALLASLLPAAVNALGTVAGMAAIDTPTFGRRRLLLTSTAAVVVALGVLGGAFALVAATSPTLDAASSITSMGSMTCPAAQALNSTTFNSAEIASCTQCVRAGCGFCYASQDASSSAAAAGGGAIAAGMGACLQLGSAAREACSAAQPGALLYAAGCPSPYGALTLVALMVYLAAFSPGLGPVPWAVNSEIYPLDVRGLATGVAATANWLTNAFVAQTFLTLTHALGPAGVFWLYAAVAAVGWVWVWAVLPETKGLTLEEIQEVFAKRAAAAGGGGRRQEVALSEASGW